MAANSDRKLFHKLGKNLRVYVLVVSASLFIGVAGYHFIEHLAWVDALLNASMILGGMGPVDPMKTIAGKLFASFYALYSGLILIGLTGLMLAPVFHYVLHIFHEARDKQS